MGTWRVQILWNVLQNQPVEEKKAILLPRYDTQGAELTILEIHAIRFPDYFDLEPLPESLDRRHYGKLSRNVKTKAST